jgi:soluble lytic murein transglycosylase
VTRFPFLGIAALFLFVPGQHSTGAGQFAATSHPVVSDSVEDLWLVPSAQERAAKRTAYATLADAVEAYGAGEWTRALELTGKSALSTGELAGYAAYYRGMSQLKLTRHAEARETLQALRGRKLHGYLPVAAALGEGEAAEAAGDQRAAVTIYEELAADKFAVNEDVLSRLGRAALAAGDRSKAAAAFVRVYYEYALSEAAIAASTQLARLEDVAVRRGVQADLGRAAMLFGARRYSEARDAYSALQGQVSGEDREVTELRIAESDYFLKRYQQALTALEPWLDRGARKAEARFFYLGALRELGRHDEYVERTRALVADFADSSWSEEALNNLGTHYILTNDDQKAAEVFAELFAKFPTGTRGERAAWKAGWWAYKNAEHQETVRIFEAAAKTYPRSDYRPSFLYWAGRAHARMGAAPQAEARLRLVHSDYGNSYYGRLALQHLPKSARTAAAADVVSASTPPQSAIAERPPTTRTIQQLLLAGLYDDAIAELRYAQRAWGNSPVVDATIAWSYNRKGELRRAITLMRRAYPQFLTAGGHELPTEILEIIFPLTYWDLIRKHATARNLDPYLIAALIAQESTFDPKIRSAANAWGLMQVVPATGRRLARSLGIRRFSTPMLTDPETNVRLGTLYFSRLVQQFGGEHYALASYNAGENRIVRWRAERPGVEQDEFIDDIPFPETQNYVKRILGTAENYRALYGKGGAGKPIPVSKAK